MHHFFHLLMPYYEFFADWVPHQKMQSHETFYNWAILVYYSHKYPFFLIISGISSFYFNYEAVWHATWRGLYVYFRHKGDNQPNISALIKFWLSLLEMWDPKLWWCTKMLSERVVTLFFILSVICCTIKRKWKSFLII